jgi:hypothetical protein
VGKLVGFSSPWMGEDKGGGESVHPPPAPPMKGGEEGGRAGLVLLPLDGGGQRWG